MKIIPLGELAVNRTAVVRESASRNCGARTELRVMRKERAKRNTGRCACVDIIIHHEEVPINFLSWRCVGVSGSPISEVNESRKNDMKFLTTYHPTTLHPGGVKTL